MRSDDTAVAGFFEDLPVLLIILAGVSTLVLSGATAGERLAELENQAELESLASRFVISMAVSLATDPSVEHASISSVRSLNISRCASDAIDAESWSAAVVLLSPSVIWLRAESRTDVEPTTCTGYSAMLLNVMMDDGVVGVVEVKALVWR